MTALRVLCCLGLMLLAAGGVPQERSEPAFLALDVYVDAGDARLAGWQAEIVLATGKLVGVEGGEAPAFADAPHYDPKALQGGRVILAALAAGDVLPSGEVRVARIHLIDQGAVAGECELRGAVAASAEGDRIEVGLRVQRYGDKR